MIERMIGTLQPFDDSKSNDVNTLRRNNDDFEPVATKKMRFVSSI